MVKIPKTKTIIPKLTASVISSILLLNGLSSRALAVNTTANNAQYTDGYIDLSTTEERQLRDKLSQPAINKLVVGALVITGLGVFIGTGVSIKYQGKAP